MRFDEFDDSVYVCYGLGIDRTIHLHSSLVPIVLACRSQTWNGHSRFTVEYVILKGMSNVYPQDSSTRESTTDPSDGRTPRSGRRSRIPIWLFVLTALSTFWVGISNWQPNQELWNWCHFGGGGFSSYFDWMVMRRLLIRNWDQGLIYMGCVMAILLTHEMGHYVAARIYRVPATVPIFLPFPFNPIGTLGAVIGMDGTASDRKQIFDIGIAGPIAGLVVAVPLAWIGVSQLDLTIPPGGRMAFESPMLLRWMMAWAGTPGYHADGLQGVWISQLNPYFAAAWVGFLVTGLNMMPVGQLDGGHVMHALFGRYAHWVAEAVIVLGIAYMVFRGIPHLAIMILLLIVVGTQHPPTRDEDVELGWGRIALGLVSLSIPLLCFPPNIFLIDF